MFSSCAWFFDDIARLEPRIVLRHAARALDFLPPATAAALEATLLGTLAHAHSNDPAEGDGIAIWRRDVLSEANGAARLAAGLAALRDLAPDALDELVMPTHTWRIDGDDIVTVIAGPMSNFAGTRHRKRWASWRCASGWTGPMPTS